jgi:hypothetical protein
MLAESNPELHRYSVGVPVRLLGKCNETTPIFVGAGNEG